jgi:hypothetical protein
MNTDPSGTATLIFGLYPVFLSYKLEDKKLLVNVHKNFQEQKVNFSCHIRNTRQKTGQDNIRVGPCLATQ